MKILKKKKKCRPPVFTATLKSLQSQAVFFLVSFLVEKEWMRMSVWWDVAAPEEPTTRLDWGDKWCHWCWLHVSPCHLYITARVNLNRSSCPPVCVCVLPCSCDSRAGLHPHCGIFSSHDHSNVHWSKAAARSAPELKETIKSREVSEKGGGQFIPWGTRLLISTYLL